MAIIFLLNCAGIKNMSLSEDYLKSFISHVFWKKKCWWRVKQELMKFRSLKHKFDYRGASGSYLNYKISPGLMKENTNVADCGQFEIVKIWGRVF